MSTQHDMDQDLVAADRYPAHALDGLDLDAARDDLRREITGVRQRRAVFPAGTRRPRWMPAVAAAAAVAVVASGGLALRGDDGTTGGVASSGSPSAPGATASGPAPSAAGGLAPTSDNLHQVVLEVPGWSVAHLAEDATDGGSMAWRKGVEDLQLTWYPAQDYPSYLRDRQRIGRERAVTALGQRGVGFSYGRFAAPPADGDIVPDPTADPSAVDPDVPDLTRWQALLPPVGDWFLEVDITLHDGSDIVPMLGRLRRVDRDAWLEHLAGADTVVPAAGEAFLTEAGRGVPLPAGLTVTVTDLHLPKDGYQARASYVVPVLCGWARQLRDARAAGDDSAEREALTALEGSADWPVVRAMGRDGDFPLVFADTVDQLVEGAPANLSRAWGCASPTG